MTCMALNTTESLINESMVDDVDDIQDCSRIWRCHEKRNVRYGFT